MWVDCGRVDMVVCVLYFKNIVVGNVFRYFTSAARPTPGPATAVSGGGGGRPAAGGGGGVAVITRACMPLGGAPCSQTGNRACTSPSCRRSAQPPEGGPQAATPIAIAHVDGQGEEHPPHGVGPPWTALWPWTAPTGTRRVVAPSVYIFDGKRFVRDIDTRVY